jgi:hypothetical protein
MEPYGAFADQLVLEEDGDGEGLVARQIRTAELVKGSGHEQDLLEVRKGFTRLLSRNCSSCFSASIRWLLSVSMKKKGLPVPMMASIISL